MKQKDTLLAFRPTFGRTVFAKKIFNINELNIWPRFPASKLPVNGPSREESVHRTRAQCDHSWLELTRKEGEGP
jgi:hypothetical protein